MDNHQPLDCRLAVDRFLSELSNLRTGTAYGMELMLYTCWLRKEGSS